MGTPLSKLSNYYHYNVVLSIYNYVEWHGTHHRCTRVSITHGFSSSIILQGCFTELQFSIIHFLIYLTYGTLVLFCPDKRGLANFVHSVIRIKLAFRSSFLHNLVVKLTASSGRGQTGSPVKVNQQKLASATTRRWQEQAWERGAWSLTCI